MKKCLVCSSEKLIKIHKKAEELYLKMPIKKAIEQAIKELNYKITKREKDALAYHIVSGAGVRWSKV